MSKKNKHSNNSNSNKYKDVSILGFIIFSSIFMFFFYLATTVPPLQDDHTRDTMQSLNISQFLVAVQGEFSWNARIGWILYKLIRYIGIPFFMIIPFLHIANLLIIYYITAGKKLNIFSLSDTRDFLVLFILYTFYNASPFEGIIWQAGTLSNNFGFLILLLFFLYVKKLVDNDSLKPATHRWGLVSSFVVGWSLETVPAHIMASFIFICIIVFYKKENIINYFMAKKMLVLAYFVSFVGYACCAISASFWSRRLGGTNKEPWNLFLDFSPMPFINQFLIWAFVASLVYYFLFKNKFSDKFKKTKEQTFIFIGFLVVLNFLSMAINFKTYFPRTFFYHSFIAGSIIFYAYLQLKSLLHPTFKKVIYAFILYIGLLNSFYMAYNIYAKHYQYNYVANILKANQGKNLVYVPTPSTIPLKSVALKSLSNFAEKYLHKGMQIKKILNFNQEPWTEIWDKKYVYTKYKISNVKKMPYSTYIKYKKQINQIPNS